MQLIFQLLGTPSDDDMKRISSEKALDLLKKLPHCKKVNFKEKFAKANPLAVDLIEKTLEFNPLKRISVNDALKHPYLAKFRQPEQETDCKTPFDFEFEKVPMTKHRLRGMFDMFDTFDPLTLTITRHFIPLTPRSLTAHSPLTHCSLLTHRIHLGGGFGVPARRESKA